MYLWMYWDSLNWRWQPSRRTYKSCEEALEAANKFAARHPGRRVAVLKFLIDHTSKTVDHIVTEWKDNLIDTNER